MIRNIIVTVSFLTLFFRGNSQTNSVRKEYDTRLINSISGTNWSIDSSNEQTTTIFKVDTFFVCSNFNPIRGIKKPDTLYIQFRYENDWCQLKIDSIEKSNLKILNTIVPKYLHYYDSIGWGKARIKKQQLLEQPKSAILQDWNKSKYISEDERNSLFKLIRLPDTLIGNVGIFHLRNFPPMYSINPVSLKIEVDNLLDKLNDNTFPSTAILRNEGYFLTKAFSEFFNEKALPSQ